MSFFGESFLRLDLYFKKLFFDNSIVIFTIIGAILGYEFKEYVVIVATSFIGSYITVRSFSILLGGFPNEFEINLRMKTRSTLSFGWRFYIYMISIVILFIFGMGYQFKRRNNQLRMMIENDKLHTLITKADEKLKNNDFI